MNQGAAAAASALLILTLVTGCGGPASETGPEIESVPTTASTPTATKTPTPSPTAPSKAEDAAALKQSIVTVADLGKPWIQPDQVPSSGKSSDACPGKPSATGQVTTTASIRRDLTEGKGQGVNIGTFRVATLPRADAADLQAAYAKDNAACKRFTDANKLFVVFSEEGPTAADNADQIVMSRAERIYYDKARKKLAYARHTIVARSGRVVTYVSYAFLTTKRDPKATDFTTTQRLLDVQLAKVTETFAE